jgi:hypothetical protein
MFPNRPRFYAPASNMLRFGPMVRISKGFLAMTIAVTPLAFLLVVASANFSGAQEPSATPTPTPPRRRSLRQRTNLLPLRSRAVRPSHFALTSSVVSCFPRFSQLLLRLEWRFLSFEIFAGSRITSPPRAMPRRAWVA